MFAPAYLDYNATAPLQERVLEAMMPWLGRRFGNASSRHEYGRAARQAVEDARARVAAAVGAQTGEVVFTSGGSEANNLFIKGCAGRCKPGVVAVGATEHPCVREPARQLGRQGWAVRELPVDAQGVLRADALSETLAFKPAIVSVMRANNETGVLQDVSGLSVAVQRYGGWLHSDGVQALGKIPVDFRQLGVDGLTISSHKVGGPAGVGALVVSRRVDLEPLVAGGGQERGIRSGTENVAGVVGFGAACQFAVERLEGEAQRLAALRDRLEHDLVALGAVVFGAGAARLPNTTFFALEHLDGETLVAKLDRMGFAVASGSACSSASPDPSRSLLAMGVEPGMARCAVRVSLGAGNSERDVGGLVQAVAQLREALKGLSALSV